MKQIPEKLINYTGYLNGSTYLGTADITLPTLEMVSDTIQGAGIAGEIDSPTIGQYSSMTVTLNWRTITQEAVQLYAPTTHAIDFRGAQQILDTSTGIRKNQQVKVSVRAMPKSGDLGKFSPSSTTDSTNEMEVIYLKVEIEGKVMIEIDKLNYKSVFNGVDYLADIREKLGME